GPEAPVGLRLVRVLELLQRFVDPVPDVGLVPGRVEGVEVCALGDDGTLAVHRPPDANWIAAEAPLVLLPLLPRQVGDELQEEHDEDVVLVLGRIDRSAEGVAGPPDDFVDVLLRGESRHGHSLHSGTTARWSAAMVRVSTSSFRARASCRSSSVTRSLRAWARAIRRWCSSGGNSTSNARSSLSE